MRLKTQRRAIYAVMGLTVLALVGGFAAATLITTVTSGGQNGYNVTAPTGTMYAGGTQTTNLIQTTATACTPNDGTVTPASAATTANVYVTGEVTCQTSTADWFEEITFTSTAVTTTAPEDAFAITVSTNAPITVNVNYSGLTVATSTVATHIFYELGPSGTAVTSSIGITGS